MLVGWCFVVDDADDFWHFCFILKNNAFLTVDAYRNNEEKQRMYAWNLTAKTILHTDKWKELFIEAGYTGDYYWFKP